MNAIKLRNIFIASILLFVVAIGVTIYFASNFLREEAAKTTHARIDTELGLEDINRLKSLEKILDENAPSIERAEQIVSDSKQYEYQDQIVNDINAYASKTGVNVIGYDFGGTTTTPVPGSAPASSTASSGVKTLEVTVSLQSPMAFDSFLRFVKAVEQNLTKMQIRGINITPDEKDYNNISNSSVVLIVYVR